MDRLLNAVAAMSRQISPEKALAIASRIRQTTPDMAAMALTGIVGTPATSSLVGELIDAWRIAGVSAAELGLMVLVSSHVVSQTAAEQSIELVWTGPITPFVSARRTEQALLQVINGATKTLFITSFVAYDIAAVIDSLNTAIDRGVELSMLLELSEAQGGSVSIDGIGKMRTHVPHAHLYAWHNKADAFLKGSVHAKIAVADGQVCFITSANLTGYAMDKNMEAGVLIVGGELPRIMDKHLRSLVDTNVILRV